MDITSLPSSGVSRPRAADLPTEEQCWREFWEIIGQAAYRIWVEDWRDCASGGESVKLPNEAR